MENMLLLGQYRLRCPQSPRATPLSPTPMLSLLLTLKQSLLMQPWQTGQESQVLSRTCPHPHYGHPK